METQIQCVENYAEYIKCGEILKSPLESYQHSIILKCFQCTDVYFLFESFVAHIQEHFKDILILDEKKKIQYQSSQDDEMESEGVGMDNVSVKEEELEDPLFPIKYEISEEKSTEKYEKDEKNSEHSATSVKDFDLDQLDEFEDVYNDSQDEFFPDEFETDEETIIKKTKSKRKNCVKGDKSNDAETDEDEIKYSSNKVKLKVSTISDEFMKSKNVKDEDKSNESEVDEDQITKGSPNKRKLKLSPLIDEFMKSKFHVLALIDLYKNQPDLWNKNSPFYRLRDKRKQFFEEITKSLNEKCSLQLSWNQTAEIISYIYGKHRDDFKRIQGKTTKKNGKKINKKQGKYEKKLDKKIKCCWFFDDLNFLRSKVIIRLQNLDANLPDLTSEQIIKILDIYQGFPHLWNTYLIENICSNKRNDALAEMLNALETTMNIKISTTALEQYIHTIHNYYSREKRQRLEKSVADDPTKNNSSNFYHQMTFLEDHEGPFNCSECNGLYTKPLCFRVHKSQHDGTVPLICSQCKQEFKSVASYTTHAKRHLEDLQFICKECNMKFLRHSDLKIHLLTHTDARPYCCEICGASYRQSNSFRKHQRRHEKRFSHTCHICSKGYYTKYRYIDHMNSHMNIRSHICKLCGKGFITSRALKTHSVTHEEARNHACNLCGKTFKLKIGVLQHMRTHGSKVETDDKRKII